MATPILGRAATEWTLDDRRFQKGVSRVLTTMNRVQASAARVGQAARNMLLIAGGAIAGFLVLAGRQQKAEAKLAAVIKATGGAAGLTAKQLIKQAAALQKVTTFGDEAIINAQAIIATFKNIKGDAFKKTTEAVLDMAIALDQDLKSAAIQVGKAMNDPILGATALSRAGVQFTQKQRDMIRTLQESNRLFGAQAIILNELQSQFGGVARAIAQTDFGKLQQLKNILGDIGESIGAIFAPALADAAGELKENAEAITEWIERNRDAIKVNTILAAKFAVLLVLLPKITAALRFVFAALTSVTLAAGGLAVAMVALIPLTLFAILSRLNQEMERVKRNMREAAASASDFKDSLEQIVRAKAAGDLAGVLAGKQGLLKTLQQQAVAARSLIQELEQQQKRSRERQKRQGGQVGTRAHPFGFLQEERQLQIDILENVQGTRRRNITELQKQIRELEAKIAKLGPAAPTPSSPAPTPAQPPRGLPVGQFFGLQGLFKAIQQRVGGMDKEANALKAAQQTSKNTKSTADNSAKEVSLLGDIRKLLKQRGGVLT